MSGAATLEAFPGDRTAQEMDSLLNDALREEFVGAYCYVTNWSTDWVAARIYAEGEMALYKISYTMADDGVITWGERTEVEQRTTYVPVPAESEGVEESVTIAGRVVEARGTDDAGGRVFRVRLIRYGESRNGRDYPESVLRGAARLYEGSKAYDHHRTLEELQTSTVQGLIGTYLNVVGEADGLYGDLHLLPGATHVAEAFDQSLANQADELPPLVGISHDVQARFRSIERDGRHLQECTAIVAVQSADVVADPAAGGQATRTLAGGPADELQPTKEGTVPEPTEVRTVEAVPPKYTRSSIMGRTLVGAAVGQTLREGFTDEQRASITEAVLTRLPEDGFTEDVVLAAVEGFKMASDTLGLAGLAPTVPHVEVTQEAFDKKFERLVESLRPNSNGTGYSSIKEAYADIIGLPTAMDFLSRGLVDKIMRESHQGPRLGVDDGRVSESLVAASWGNVLADALNRRIIEEYAQPSLQTWRKIVSATPPRGDFRSNKITRIGGYGTLPAVGEGGTYQPLTSPSDEKVTYTISKRGGTEDLTLEMIANDDMGAIARIPSRLGRAAAITLYRFVWDMLPANAAVYDSVALFHSSHANTTTGALSQTALSALRLAMRKQAAFGDSVDVLGLAPKFLIVPPDLEEIAYQLSRSAVAIPATPAGPTNTPNIHEGTEVIVVDYYSDANDWYVVADPASCPTIEVGFFNGQQDPQMFIQDDPTQGAAFAADKVTYKIRHIYSGAVLDWRAFQRSAN